MKNRVRLSLLARRDASTFLDAVRASRRLHGSWVTPPDSPAAFEALIARMDGKSNVGLVARRRDSGALVGFIEITNIVRGSFRSACLGYYAFAGHERQGLMRESLQLAVRRAFSQTRLHRLEANIQPENAASIALVRACGFRKEGTRRGISRSTAAGGTTNAGRSSHPDEVPRRKAPGSGQPAPARS